MKKLLIIDPQTYWAEDIVRQLESFCDATIVSKATPNNGRFDFARIVRGEKKESSIPGVASDPDTVTPMPVDITQFDAVIMSYKGAGDSVPGLPSTSLRLIAHWVSAGFEKPIYLVTSTVNDCKIELGDEQLNGDAKVCQRDHDGVALMLEELKRFFSA